MDDLSHVPPRDSLGAFLSFFGFLTALILGVFWAWSLFQSRPVVAQTVTATMVVEPTFVSQPVTTPGTAEATEAADAASAHAMSGMMGIGLAGPQQFVGNSIKQTTISTLSHASMSMISTPRPAGTAQVIPASLAPSKDIPDTTLPGRVNNPRIAIIIDDMGLARKNSLRATELDATVTLSYLPYAEDIQMQVDAARAKGHEIMLHLPMEPFDHGMYPGPKALTARLSPDELKQNLSANLSAFRGYVGINNHMGSRLTSTPAAMEIVMDEIDRRNVYFVDSWTSSRSVAYQAAADEGIARGRRDVFLDHDEGEAAVWHALKQAEYIARRHGSAIVIGHPKNDTISVLRAWLPGAKDRGVQIVPMSQLTYRGSVERDPALLADVARRHNAPRKLARLSPASGE